MFVVCFNEPEPIADCCLKVLPVLIGPETIDCLIDPEVTAELETKAEPDGQFDALIEEGNLTGAAPAIVADTELYDEDPDAEPEAEPIAEEGT